MRYNKMPMEVTTLIQRRGLNTKFFFTITSPNNTASTVRTEEHNINNLAMLLFTFSCPGVSNSKRVVTMSCKKIKSTEHFSVRMNLTSKTMKFLHYIDCPDVWVNWKTMGEVGVIVQHNNKVYLSVIDVSVSAYKVAVPGFMSKLYSDTELTDFHLTADNGKVAVHRACLAAHSNVFKRMLTGKWKETEEGCIEMKGVTLETLQHLKEYMYMGSLPEDRLCPLLLVASRYLIQDLKAQCIIKLVQSATPESLWTLLAFAGDNQITDLSFAIAQLIPDDVLHGSHELVTKMSNEEEGRDT